MQRFFAVAKNSLVRGVQLDRIPADLLVLNSGKKVPYHGRRADPYTDPVLLQLQYPFTVWEPPIQWHHETGNVLFRGRTFFLDSLHLLMLLAKAAGIGISNRRISEEIRFLEEHFAPMEVRAPRAWIRFLLTNIISSWKYVRPAVSRLLSLKRPRVILLVNHYDPLKMLITRQAHEMGVYVVELQHGNMGSYHQGYNLGTDERLPELPDEILTFGAFWNRTTSIRKNGVKLTATGMPFFEENVRRYLQTPPSKGAKKQILFLSQESLGPKMAQIALDLKRMLPGEEYEIYYKLHPREYQIWEKVYPAEFLRGGLRVLAGTDLYQLLSQADVIIGVYSTTVIESLAFGKPLILLEFYGVHYFLDLVRSGRAHLAHSAEEIRAILTGLDRRESTGISIRDFWEENSLERIRTRICEIMEKNL